MTTRAAWFAGQFYPSDSKACAGQADALLDLPDLPPMVGGLIPHAGWTYSGPTAARTVAALREYQPETIVVFGAVHVRDLNRASLFPRGSWQTPTGDVHVDAELAAAIDCRDVTIAPSIHAQEHSIEVELPLIRRAFPSAKILPLMVRPGDWAAGVGLATARAALAIGRRVAVLASTDLTHYGPRFGFVPHGTGPEGVRWAHEVNDRRFVDVVARMDAGGSIREAALSRNACGAGAVAAAIQAAAELGAGAYRELEHTSSAERIGGPESQRRDSVGYHSGVFCI